MNVGPRVEKRTPKGPFSVSSRMKVRLYDLLNPAASQASRANLDCPGRAIDEGFYGNDVGSEHTFGGHTNMLTYSTFLLELTLSGDTVSSDGSLSTNITSTCHDYIHLVFNIHHLLLSPMLHTWSN